MHWANVHGKVSVAGKLQVCPLWEETRGCPNAGQKLFQPALTDPPQDTAEPSSNSGDTSVTIYLRKNNERNKNAAQEPGEREE